MSNRDLLRKANAGNAQKRGTEAVLNEEPVIKTSNTKAATVKNRSIEEPPTTPLTKIQEKEPTIERDLETITTPIYEPKIEENIGYKEVFFVPLQGKIH